MGNKGESKPKSSTKTKQKKGAETKRSRKREGALPPYMALQDAVVNSNAAVRFVDLSDSRDPDSVTTLNANSWVRVHDKMNGVLQHPARLIIVHDPVDSRNNGQLAEVANTLQITWDKKKKSPQSKRLDKIVKKKRTIHGMMEFAIEFDL